MLKFQGSVKRSGISRGVENPWVLVFLTVEFPPKGVTQFFRILRGKILFPKGKVKNLKIPEGFFRRV